MQLNFSQIKAITTGAVRVLEETDGIHFFRFTVAQEEVCVKKRAVPLDRTVCTSGITLFFKTNSSNLGIKIKTFESQVSFRRAVIDITVNGSLFDSIEIMDEGEAEKKWDIGAGEKEIRIYLPWCKKTVLQALYLDDGADITPVKCDKKLIAFGDSITHGFNAIHPMNKYVTRLADYLGAEEFNKAIGGDTFSPLLAKETDDFVPDYITVAYGTNDWNSCPRELFVTRANQFYKTLSENYPNAKIYAITPIWRKDMHEERECGSFLETFNIIRDAVAELSNVTIVNGLTLVPHDEKYYGDKRLHPNDEGFEYYFKSLSKSI